MPIFFSRSPICGPPPWTITGFMPTSFSITTSRAKPAFSCRLGHRVAAVLDDDRLVVEALDVGQRLGEDLRLQGGIDGVDGHGGRGREVGGAAIRYGRRGRSPGSGSLYRNAARRDRRRTDRRGRRPAPEDPAFLLSLPSAHRRRPRPVPRDHPARPDAAADSRNTDAPCDHPPGLRARGVHRAVPRGRTRGAAGAQRRGDAGHAERGTDAAAADRGGRLRPVPRRAPLARRRLRAGRLPGRSASPAPISSRRTSRCPAATSTAPTSASTRRGSTRRTRTQARCGAGAWPRAPTGITSSPPSGRCSQARGCAP